ncbi:hypothetical protein OCOJLMKI_0631 [Methylobacterium iners]|jgi:hypothetical protein|uniref:Uncharacterized protein n=1 Tax=Methylobacterium iners TaxID=418707 RepID=A0ABQ4RTX6_9HYPH|nr:hypothetical protein OCOJLMKI_0631 [Methylobacterium iners]
MITDHHIRRMFMVLSALALATLPLLAPVLP